MAIDLPVLINGKSYEWNDITVNILNVPVSGIISLEYEERQEKVNVFGAGSRPVSRGKGRKETTAKITLKMEEAEALAAAAPNGDILDIPAFDIIITYFDASLVTKVHRLRNVEFMNNRRVANEGDQSLDVEMDLVVSHIEWV